MHSNGGRSATRRARTWPGELVSIPVVLTYFRTACSRTPLFRQRSVASSDRAPAAQATPELFQFGKYAGCRRKRRRFPGDGAPAGLHGLGRVSAKSPGTPAFERLRRLEGRLLAEGREFLCLCGHHRELLAGVPGRDFEELRRRFNAGQFVGLVRGRIICSV